jgi:hypothetical protein
MEIWRKKKYEIAIPNLKFHVGYFLQEAYWKLQSVVMELFSFTVLVVWKYKL